ncbi:MAG: hypothetical protein E7425_12845 [Ruminococcaceae bacterium]|nr:hypothetical protein [Oscillospiraceae bacterium]
MDKENRLLLRYVRVGVWLLAALFAAVCIALAILIPRVNDAVGRVTQTFGHLETVLVEVDELSVKADEALVTATEALESATTAANNANQLVVDNSDAVSEAMAKINAVDFDALNRAINDLADVVEPLANVTNFFKN